HDAARPHGGGARGTRPGAAGRPQRLLAPGRGAGRAGPVARDPGPAPAARLPRRGRGQLDPRLRHRAGVPPGRAELGAGADRHRYRGDRAAVLRPVLQGHRARAGPFAGLLTAFAGAMVGLVLADDAMMLYTFWERTTVFSYLLVGHYQDKQASRRAALNALISTTAGGLAMLVGLLMVAAPAGSMRLSAIIADPMWEQPGPYLVTAMVLI